MRTPPLPPLIDLKTVLRLTGIKQRTLFAMRARGEFPEHVWYRADAPRWERDAVLAWIAERRSGRAASG